MHRFTTFRDIVDGIETNAQEIPLHHPDLIPKIAQDITEILTRTVIIIVRCECDVVVLEGAHRIAALAYAKHHHLPVPQTIRTITCTIPPSDRAQFDAFCEDIPRIFGPYHSEKV
jgi:hypothetical protein